MPNPFFQTVQPINNFTNIKDVYKLFSSSKNPMDLFIKMANQNPNLKSIIPLIQSGNNPQTIFNQLCQQRGINPQDFLKSITG